MLHFIYSGNVPDLSRLARQLLAAADKYSLRRLKVSSVLNSKSGGELHILGNSDLSGQRVGFISGNDNLSDY